MPKAPKFSLNLKLKPTSGSSLDFLENPTSNQFLEFLQISSTLTLDLGLLVLANSNYETFHGGIVTFVGDKFD